jgi:hypothetical protein
MMQEVIANRQNGRAWISLPETPPVDGYIAVLDCAHLGEIWTLREQGADAWERFWVVDCAGDDATRRWMLDNNITVEFDYETVARWGYVGLGVPIERLHYMETVGEKGLTQ